MSYGKGFIKSVNLSPDAYIQMAINLAYFRECGKLDATYQPTMTRLFRYGRTSNIHSSTTEAKAFVNAMEDKTGSDSKRFAHRLLKAFADMREMVEDALGIVFQSILDNDQPPSPGEELLASLTAGDRDKWAEVREKYFSKGLNKTSLDLIERAATEVVLDDREYEDMDMQGYTAEHSWGDATVTSQMFEHIYSKDVYELGYRDDGHCRGEPEINPPPPSKLVWDIPEECIEEIEKNYVEVTEVIAEIDLYCCAQMSYGKGFIKSVNLSPDAYIQMAINLAYFRECGKLDATYQPTMNLFFRYGRTSNVHSSTTEARAFVNAMEDKTISNEERFALLKKACDNHQYLTRQSMIGQNYPRHIFAMIFAARDIKAWSSFLDLINYDDSTLIATQSSLDQTGLMRLKEFPENGAPGGCFGVIRKDNYGVFYTMSGENMIYIHVSSKVSTENKDSKRFAHRLLKAFTDMREMVEDALGM
ncbi:carnitine O-palmitoyltransferase 1, liver isoform-like [Tubulanus polymorphus]|uniref:carnitine O-palmitoyltransferase 1, liver isoform-like n=1 Tax=Tubulanus polymorphus TaxID=672921 RepID=UPI003DA520F2